MKHWYPEGASMDASGNGWYGQFTVTSQPMRADPGCPLPSYPAEIRQKPEGQTQKERYEAIPNGPKHEYKTLHERILQEVNTHY
eukprot:gene25640-1716_t